MDHESIEGYARPMHRLEPLRCENTAHQYARLAEEILEALEAADADDRIIVTYEKAAEHYLSRAQRLRSTSDL